MTDTPDMAKLTRQRDAGRVAQQGMAQELVVANCNIADLTARVRELEAELKESRKFIAFATSRIAELENTAKAVSKMHDDSEAEIVTLHDRIKELEADNERLQEIEAAARQCVKDDCDAVIHPDCWKRLHSALLKGTGDD